MIHLLACNASNETLCVHAREFTARIVLSSPRKTDTLIGSQMAAARRVPSRVSSARTTGRRPRFQY